VEGRWSRDVVGSTVGESGVGVGAADSWKDSTRKRERGTFSMEIIKWGRKEWKKVRDARGGLTAPLGVVGLASPLHVCVAWPLVVAGEATPLPL
jgi:hypothetical protein